MSREIMQQALDAFEAIMFETDAESCQIIAKNARYALREELAKPNDFYPDWDMLKPYHERIAELEAQLAKPEQEPVRWFQQFGDAPPRKEWVGLTNDEINDFDKKLRDNGDYCSLHFAWGISAKLKERNT